MFKALFITGMTIQDVRSTYVNSMFQNYISVYITLNKCMCV